MNTGWQEIDIRGCYILVKIAFALICPCNNDRRIWRHSASTLGSSDITDQLWWRHNTESEKTVLNDNGRIRLSVSTINRTYELSGITHVTPFRKYGKHSTGPSTYGPWARTYSKLFSCKPVLTVCSYGAQSNEICTYGRVSRGTIPRVRRYGLLYLRTVEYD